MQPILETKGNPKVTHLLHDKAEKEKKKVKSTLDSNMIDLNPNISIVTLNMNDLKIKTLQ